MFLHGTCCGILLHFGRLTTYTGHAELEAMPIQSNSLASQDWPSNFPAAETLVQTASVLRA
eukprot:573282-Amphidinium_carterae.1